MSEPKNKYLSRLKKYKNQIQKDQEDSWKIQASRPKNEDLEKSEAEKEKRSKTQASGVRG